MTITTLTITAEQTQERVTAAIGRCLRGDQSGYESLFAEFAPGICRLCYSLLFNTQDAEDVTQESFVYAFKNLERYDAERASFKTWLYTIAVSRCRNVYRRKHPMIDLLNLFQHDDIPAPKSETPEAAFAHQSAQEAIEQAIVALSPRLREAVVLRYGHGLTYREIAEVMDCPQKTAESRVRLAHEALRGLLQPTGQGLLDELLSV
ncbi:MAG: sigma-70 family RNA polymerase sigma factor [Burkholderiales bacterium]|nr:sigma-70 family RNA polymerase sigma factor [Anaerolineae bacterium]